MTDLDALSDALLYEGYLLYPYGSSALKNQRRFPLGALYPPAFCAARREGDGSSLHLECLGGGGPRTAVTVRLRFLQLKAGGAVACDVATEALMVQDLRGHSVELAFPPISGELSVTATFLERGVFKLVLDVENRAAFPEPDRRGREDALLYAAVSPHLVLMVTEGELVSLADPPEPLRHHADACRNVGTWPVLAGERGARDTLLSAPLVLSDYPEIAPESPGDLFDATEIDEILTLRILTLSDREKHELPRAQPRAGALLARTESLGERELERLHGRVQLGPMRAGTRVVLRPKGRADIFDLALDGKSATIRSVERDLEGRAYLAVTVDDDPGGDMGAYAHRFFFRPDEVEVL